MSTGLTVARDTGAMSSGPLAFAFVTGVVAAFNPCGFAMLPAYVTTFVGRSAALDSKSSKPIDLATRIARAGVVSASVTAGFMVVFAAVGLAIKAAQAPINDYLPWITIAIGLALAVVGAQMLAGREFAVRLPKMQRGGGDGGVVAMTLYGMSYATVSISCTLPLFLGVVTTAFGEDFLSGVANYLAYAAGMGMVLTILTFAVATAQQAVVRGMRRILPYVTRISGFLLFFAGLYVAAYGWYEREIRRSADLPSGPIAKVVGSVTDWSSNIQSQVASVGAWVLGALLIVAIGSWATALGISRLRTRRSI